MVKLVFPKQTEPPRSFGWVGDLVLGMFDGLDVLEIVWWIIRMIFHALAIAARVIFHVLTCHF